MTTTVWLLPDLGLFVSELRQVISEWPTRVELSSDDSSEASEELAVITRALDRLADSLVSEPDGPARLADFGQSRLLTDLLVPAAASFSVSEPPAIALELAIPGSRAARLGWPLLELRTTGVHLRVLPAPAGPPPRMATTRHEPLAGAVRAAALMADDPVAAGVLIVVEAPRTTLYDQEAADLARRRPN